MAYVQEAKVTDNKVNLTFIQCRINSRFHNKTVLLCGFVKVNLGRLGFRYQFHHVRIFAIYFRHRLRPTFQRSVLNTLSWAVQGNRGTRSRAILCRPQTLRLVKCCMIVLLWSSSFKCDVVHCHWQYKRCFTVSRVNAPLKLKIPRF